MTSEGTSRLQMSEYNQASNQKEKAHNSSGMTRFNSLNRNDNMSILILKTG